MLVQAKVFLVGENDDAFNVKGRVLGPNVRFFFFVFFFFLVCFSSFFKKNFLCILFVCVLSELLRCAHSERIWSQSVPARAEIRLH